jgi:hypothetical protein
MAKRKVNKTQAVKDFLAENPDAATNDVVAAMKKQRIVVSANYVSTIKSNLKGGGKAKKKVAAKKKAAPKKKAADDKISLSALMEAKKLAAKLGGIEKAKEAISALAQLTD